MPCTTQTCIANIAYATLSSVTHCDLRPRCAAFITSQSNSPGRSLTHPPCAFAQLTAAGRGPTSRLIEGLLHQGRPEGSLRGALPRACLPPRPVLGRDSNPTKAGPQTRPQDHQMASTSAQGNHLSPPDRQVRRRNRHPPEAAASSEPKSPDRCPRGASSSLTRGGPAAPTSGW